MDFLDLIQISSGAVSGATAAGAFKAPIQTLNDLWYIHFGSSVSKQAERIKIQQKLDLEKYELSIAAEIAGISEENIQEPKISILGPALEASKYYIQEEELRNMFAKLVGASIDKSKNKVVHHSFVEIIKQMSPLDAQNLKLFQPLYVLPIAQILSKENPSSVSHVVMQSDIFLENTNCKDLNILATSITNLSRLGILNISYKQNLTSPGIYDKFKQHPCFLLYNQLNLEQGQATELAKGVVYLTSFGKSFTQACL